MSVRIRADLGKKVAALAEAFGRSKSWVIEQALEKYLGGRGWQVEAIEAGVAEADSGRLVSHETVKAWVGSWGRKHERRRPGS